MSYQLPTPITRKARFWPEVPKGAVKLPVAPAFVEPSALSLLSIIFSSLCSLFIGIAILFYVGMLPEPGFLIPGVLVSLVLVQCLCVFYGARFFVLRRIARQAQRQYRQQLQEVEKHLQVLHTRERQAYMELSPPLFLPPDVPAAYEHLTVVPVLDRSFDEQDHTLWVRRPTDPDFLSVRFGLGLRPASFQVQEVRHERSALLAGSLAQRLESAQESYSSLMAPLTVTLYKRTPVAIVGSYAMLAHARTLVQGLVAQLAYHHSPQDVRIILLAPQTQNLTWQWMRALPHTQSLEQMDDAAETQLPRMVALGSYAVNEQLAALSRELGRRELLLHDLTSQPQAFGSATTLAQLPHLVIIVDHFEAEEEANAILYAAQVQSSRITSPSPSQSLLSPLQRPELMRAIYHGPQLGVSILCINVQQSSIPANCSALLHLHGASMPDVVLLETTPLPSMPKHDLKQSAQNSSDNKTEQANDAPQIKGVLYELRPDPAAPLICNQLDLYPAAVLHEFSRRMQHLRACPEKHLELRMQVDLRVLFTPALEVTGSQNWLHWQDPAFRIPSFTGKASPLLRIPVGMKRGDELQYLDLLKDGPHGLLVGQAGSGKNELLQALLLAFAVAYRPAEMALLLIDQGTGQTLAPFRALPHTLGYLDRDPSPALLQRFITMLHTEITERQGRLHEGKAFPRLLIVIDECLAFSEAAATLLDELLTLMHASRDLGMYLLFSSSSPFNREGGVPGKVRQYEQIRDQVQYRLCLRCASVEESQAVIYRGDAAFLPASLPGRTYFLHSDQQLDLFQAARFMQPLAQEPTRLFPRHEPSTDKDIAAAFIRPIMEV